MESALKQYMDGFKGKRVAVIGLGVSNTPLVERLLDAGVDVLACDKRRREEFNGLIESLELQRLDEAVELLPPPLVAGQHVHARVQQPLHQGRVGHAQADHGHPFSLEPVHILLQCRFHTEPHLLNRRSAFARRQNLHTEVLYPIQFHLTITQS